MLCTNDPSVNQHKKKLIINTTTLLSFLSLDTMAMFYVRYLLKRERNAFDFAIVPYSQEYCSSFTGVKECVYVPVIVDMHVHFTDSKCGVSISKYVRTLHSNLEIALLVLRFRLQSDDCNHVGSSSSHKFMCILNSYSLSSSKGIIEPLMYM